MSSKKSTHTILCPCGAAQTYAQCCGAYHSGAQHAATAQALMRSRYCAYVLNNFDYLCASWHPSTCPSDLGEHDDAQVPTKWMGLNIKKSWQGEGADEAFVEFIAKYKVGGNGVERLHEVSRFVREDGRWFYVDGVFVNDSVSG